LKYKIEQKDNLVSVLKEKGLRVVEFEDEDGEFVKVFDGELEVGLFEPGNELFELVCYSIEAEQAAKKYGLMDLIEEYWPWYSTKKEA